MTLTGEGWAIDEIEQGLNPAPMRVEEILEWFLVRVSMITLSAMGSSREDQSIPRSTIGGKDKKWRGRV